MMVVGYTATELLIAAAGVYSTTIAAQYTYLISYMWPVILYTRQTDRRNNRSAPSLIIFVLFSIKATPGFFFFPYFVRR